MNRLIALFKIPWARFKDAHMQLHLLTGMRTAKTVLAWQIELCDVLLVEISSIRTNLAKDIKHTRRAPQVGGDVRLIVA